MLEHYDRSLASGKPIPDGLSTTVLGALCLGGGGLEVTLDPALAWRCTVVMLGMDEDGNSKYSESRVGARPNPPSVHFARFGQVLVGLSQKGRYLLKKLAGNHFQSMWAGCSCWINCGCKANKTNCMIAKLQHSQFSYLQ